MGSVRNTASAQLETLAHLRRARDFADREAANGIDVTAMSRAAHMSVAHFSRQFKLAYGETPHTYLMTRRLERAQALLRHHGTSVTEACFAVGASSLGSFSSRFTELVGETPSSYRAREHQEFELIPGCVAKEVARPRRERPQHASSSIREAQAIALV